MEVETNLYQLKTFYNFIIIITIGIILFFSYIIISEILDAKKDCESLKGNYKLVFFKHLCNNQTFLKHSYGWDYEKKPFNLTDYLKLKKE